MIRNITECIALNNGGQMPGFGFGLYKAHGTELDEAVNVAWRANYRLYDTAAYYENEETTGSALKPYPIADYFLISKIWPTDFGHPVAALDSSLKKLRRDYLDGFLLHWPGRDEKAMLKAWEHLMREVEKGKIRTLGASNFLPAHLEAIQRNFGIWPAINQIEIHPYFQQKDLCAFCASNNITVMAWSPLGRGAELEDSILARIAAETGKTTAQIILRWHIQENRVPIPKSVHPDRIRANADVFDFSLTTSQIESINNLEKPSKTGRRGPDPMLFP